MAETPVVNRILLQPRDADVIAAHQVEMQVEARVRLVWMSWVHAGLYGFLVEKGYKNGHWLVLIGAIEPPLPTSAS